MFSAPRALAVADGHLRSLLRAVLHAGVAWAGGQLPGQGSNAVLFQSGPHIPGDQSGDGKNHHYPHLLDLHPRSHLLPCHSLTSSISTHQNKGVKVSFFKDKNPRRILTFQRRPQLPLNSTRNFDLLYISETKHRKLDRADYR